MTQTIVIPTIKVEQFTIKIIGDTSLISHRFSDQEKQQILDKQMRKPAKQREPKNPEEQFENSIYYTNDGLYGFPAIAIKNAAVSACRFLPDMKMTEARGAFFVMGEIIPINGEPTIREDIVRLNGRTADIRYRAEYIDWIIPVTVRFNPNIISIDGVVSLINLAGFHIGIGDWRPEKNGTHGMFHVES